jgi:hypothetical protein
MVIYKEAGVELIQARGEEGRFAYDGETMRLGVFNEADSWYIGVHRFAGGFVARLSLEDAATLKEAKDMLRYGFFLQMDAANMPLIRFLSHSGFLHAPSLDDRRN